ncbi:recombinase family protein [Mesorhizobium sp. M0674]|uniref:recombinase family protein n=1 Tax=Mesorhizobium sp. M0674 TaxID=2956983 RepID=UPI003335A59A
MCRILTKRKTGEPPFAKLRYGSKECPLFQNRLKNRLNSGIQAAAVALARSKRQAISIGWNGAPEEIRTPDPQIRSLKLFVLHSLYRLYKDLASQLERLEGAGCQKIFFEKQGGKNADRRQLQRLLKVLKPGDVVHAYGTTKLINGRAYYCRP